jgi:hypothetical protein
MNLDNKNSEEIQKEIYTAIANGVHIDSLKAEIKAKGLHPEGYYFTTEVERNRVMDEPIGSSSNVSPMRIVWLVISIIILIVKIVRCSNM